MAPRLASSESSRGAFVLSAALVPLFLHADYQPSLDVGDVTLRLADAAVGAVVVAAAVEARRVGLARLAAAPWVWAATLALFAAIAVSALAASASPRAYPLGEHLVTAAKYAEYALLAIAFPLLVRRRRDAVPVVVALTLLSGAAAVVGVLQLVGVPLLDEWPAGRRQPSFLGHHDFAALAGAALAWGLVALLLGTRSPRETRLAAVAGASGVVGLVVSGAVTGAAGAALAAVVSLAAVRGRTPLTRGRIAAVAAAVAVVVAGVLAIRSANIADFLDDERTGHVETFSHRGVLAYIGVREFADHPLLGIGWQASLDEGGYGPYVDDARRRYPDQPARVFPSPAEPWGIQNAYLQALADMGVVGGAALVALLASGLYTGVRTTRRAMGSPDAALALTGTLCLCVVAGIWNGIGLIAGLPLDALLWLALGAVASAAAGLQDGHE